MFQGMPQFLHVKMKLGATSFVMQGLQTYNVPQQQCADLAEQQHVSVLASQWVTAVNVEMHASVC